MTLSRHPKVMEVLAEGSPHRETFERLIRPLKTLTGSEREAHIEKLNEDENVRAVLELARAVRTAADARMPPHQQRFIPENFQLFRASVRSLRDFLDAHSRIGATVSLRNFRTESRQSFSFARTAHRSFVDLSKVYPRVWGFLENNLS